MFVLCVIIVDLHFTFRRKLVFHLFIHKAIIKSPEKCYKRGQQTSAQRTSLLVKIYKT